MSEQDQGASAKPTGLSSTTEPQSSQGLGPAGFDPSRTSLQDALRAIEQKAAAAKARAEAAQREYEELRVTAKVLRDFAANRRGTIAGNSTAASLLSIIPIGSENGASPKEIYDLLNRPEITADAVRTSLWRLADRGHIGYNDGKYFRRDSDRSGEAIETTKIGSTEGESAGLKGIAQDQALNQDSSNG